MINRQSNVIEYAYADQLSVAEDVSEPQKPDYLFNQMISHFTGGADPIAYTLAFTDWYLHLLLSLGKQQSLRDIALQQLTDHDPDKSTENSDFRLKGKEWQAWPYSVFKNQFLAMRNWWQQATRNVPGAEQHHINMVNFFVNQAVDAFSPANSPFTNPNVVAKTQSTSGANLIKGVTNYFEDLAQSKQVEALSSQTDFNVGENIAISPGKVVFKNDLLELIQYSPTTEEVCAEPILITPAWIMKYYILDLSPHNSLVKYLVEHGHTVFMISWKNPDPSDHNLGLIDYLKDGLGKAIEVVQARVPEQPINGVGYCLGGTLLAMAAAWLAREERNPFKAITLLAAQTDFTDAGDLRLFIDESQLSMLEAVMAKQGYLPAESMAGTFAMLRSNAMLWSKVTEEYLIGERQSNSDLMAWNKDITRMPAKMHAQYLRQCYLNNALANGQFLVDGRPIALADIQVPLFVVGTAKDHVAPWQSVYKINLLIDKDITFVLTSGGHNAGILSEPGHPRRVYQIATRKEDGAYLPPQAWLDDVPLREGSWWPQWHSWLESLSSGKAPARSLDAEQCMPDAPGKYVLQS